MVFVGNVGNVNEWYSAFDVFVLPSIWEGLPVVGVEAQASDLPCVFSDSITREIELSDRVEFVGINESVEKWADILQTMFTISNRRNNKQLMIDNDYDIQTEAIKLQNRYLKMVGEENENREY